MRIAYIINSTEGGGAALPVPDVARLMQAQGHQVRVFALTRRDGRAIAPMTAAGLTVDIREGSKTDHLSALLWLIRRLRDWGPTHLWTSLSRATLLGQVAGQILHLPVISWQHSARLRPPNGWMLRKRRNRSALWVADSASVAEATRTTLRVPPERLIQWPLFRANPQAPTAKPWTPGETLRIGALGRLHPVKGFDMLIEAASRLQKMPGLPPFSLSLAGEGEERPRLEALAREHGISVEFTGYCADPLAFLSSLHLYIQPSHWEGLCLAAHEAMLCGLPVIASPAGEIPFTVLEGETGLIFRPRHVDHLTEAMARLLATPEALAPLGTAARARVLERFGPDAFDCAGKHALLRASGL